MNLAAHQKAHPQVNAIAFQSLRDVKTVLLADGKSPVNVDMVRRIDEFLKKPSDFKVISAPKIPDGSPIGMDCMH